MALARLAARAAALAAAGTLLAVGLLAGSEGGGASAQQLTARGDPSRPLPVPAEAGAVEASWKGRPVVVFAVPAAALQGVEAARGAGEATPSVALPGGLRLFALSAESTHLGCTVAFLPRLGASEDVPDYDGDGRADGRLLDACHHGQWDPYNRGKPVGGPAPARLAALDVAVDANGLVATRFDGPVGRQA